MREILARVTDEGTVDVAALAASFGVSGATIRRDLKALNDRRLLVRTHGGAVTNDVGIELPIRYKEARHHPEKRRVGLTAAGLVERGAVVGLTGGTTTTEVARALAERDDLTFVTNALNIAAELVLRPTVRLLVVGGKARHASYELVGATAEAMLAAYHFDVLFIGVDGLAVTEGCTTHDEMEAHTDLAFIQRAQRTVVVTDSSKIGKVRFAKICDLRAISDLVTDSGIDANDARGFERAGVRVIRA